MSELVIFARSANGGLRRLGVASAIWAGIEACNAHYLRASEHCQLRRDDEVLYSTKFGRFGDAIRA